MHVSRDLFLIGGRGFQHHYYIQSFQCIHNVLKRQRIKAKLTPSECIFVRTAGTGGELPRLLLGLSYSVSCKASDHMKSRLELKISYSTIIILIAV